MEDQMLEGKDLIERLIISFEQCDSLEGIVNRLALLVEGYEEEGNPSEEQVNEFCFLLAALSSDRLRELDPNITSDEDALSLVLQEISLRTSVPS